MLTRNGSIPKNIQVDVKPKDLGMFELDGNRKWKNDYGAGSSVVLTHLSLLLAVGPQTTWGWCCGSKDGLRAENSPCFTRLLIGETPQNVLKMQYFE